VTTEPTVLPAAGRLRRLRWRITIAFTLANVVGLAVLAAVAVVVDEHSRQASESAEMTRRLTAAVALLYDDPDGHLVLTDLRDDEVGTGHPELYVMTGPPNSLVEVFAGQKRQFTVAGGPLRDVARRAMASDADARVESRDSQGRPVYLRARPFYDDAHQDSPAGAVVAVGDPNADAAAHNQLRLAAALGVLTLAAASAAIGHLLSGRGVRPAVVSLAQQERFLADAAHELRTPVAVLRASTEAALKAPELDRVEVERAARQAERLGAIVDALLTRARLAAGVQPVAREPLRLDQLVEDVVAETASLAGAHPDSVTVSTEPSVVDADPTLLRLAVRNMADNALRHGRQTGRPPLVRVKVSGPVVTVSDDGPGIPEELATDGTTRYRTAGGTGVGMSIVSWVATAHGGRVTIENAATGGVVVTLTLGSPHPGSQ
jgi:two-component system OmpR family sensor kinase